MDLQERLTGFAMLGATWVMWLLVALSIIGLAIVFERIFFMLLSRDNIQRLRHEITALLRRGDIEGTRDRLAQSKSFEAQVVKAGVENAEGGIAAVKEHMEGETRLARLKMERNLAFLGTVGNNAPFIGLLGTVIGVMRAFQELNASEGRVTGGLMSEIGEALVATAIGILVALPSVAFFNAFQRIIKARIMRAESLGNVLIAHMESDHHASLQPQAPSQPQVVASEGV